MGQHHSNPPTPVEPFGSCRIGVPTFSYPTGTCADATGAPGACPTVTMFDGASGRPGGLSLDSVPLSACNQLGGQFSLGPTPLAPPAILFDPCGGGSAAACGSAVNPPSDGAFIIYNNGQTKPAPTWYPPLTGYRELQCTAGAQPSCTVVADGMTTDAGKPVVECPANSKPYATLQACYPILTVDPCLAGGSPAACGQAIQPDMGNEQIKDFVVYNHGQTVPQPAWYPPTGQSRAFHCAAAGSVVACVAKAGGAPEPGCPDRDARAGLQACDPCGGRADMGDPGPACGRALDPDIKPDGSAAMLIAYGEPYTSQTPAWSPAPGQFQVFNCAKTDADVRCTKGASGSAPLQAPAGCPTDKETGLQECDPCVADSARAECAAALQPPGLVDGKVTKMIVYNDGTTPTPPIWYPAVGAFREFACVQSGNQIGCGAIATGPLGSPPSGCPPATAGLVGMLPCTA
jgi:hypothetical protein